MIPLTHEESKPYKEQEKCHICEERFCIDKNDENYIYKRKVKDHCHYSGKFREAAHSKCNLNYKVPKDIPIIIHNASYDTHFIINQLAEEFKGEIFLYQLRKNLVVVKKLHTNLDLLIVLDLCRPLYHILLIMRLEFLIV